MPDQPAYGFGMTLEMPTAEAIERVKAALATQGFGILAEIDVQKTLKTKLDVDTRPYVILGACNPPLAYRGLTAEPNLGLLLPCNVIVYAEDERDQRAVVSIMNPHLIPQVTANPALDSLAQNADARLRAALATLQE